MTVNKFFGVEGAKQATGVTVIIDVLRAATVAAYLLDKGVSKIIPVSTAEEAFAYKESYPDAILVGEEHGIKINGFDLGNSPFEIRAAINLGGKTVVHRSSQGTQGMVFARGASQLIFGSFTTCTAIANYVSAQSAPVVSVVAMDGEGSEDDLYADYLIATLTNQPPKPIKEIVEFMRNHPGGARFLDPLNKEFPEQDFYLCLEVDRFNFVPVVKDGAITKLVV